MHVVLKIHMALCHSEMQRSEIDQMTELLIPLLYDTGMD